MRTRLPALAAFLFLLAVPATNGAQEVSRRLEPASARAVEELADVARADGLPVEALHAKVAEGMLKSASDTRIVAAVRTLLQELREAQGALGPASSSGELVAGATALHAGVPADRLRQLRRATSDRAAGSLALPLVVLVDLVTRRVPAEVAARSIEQLLQSRASDSELQSLRSIVEQDILGGQSPSEAAAARTRTMVERIGGRLESARPPARPSP